jgi:glycerophosphoryl diester phosphodiesterase
MAEARASKPFVVAHRAGNDLELLRRAADVRPHLIEADVHLFAGRLEVRHLKTLGPVPILWDRWYLASPRTARLELAQLLVEAGADTPLMLDLKGRNRVVSRRVAAELARHRPAGDVAVCSRSWRLLEPFLDAPGIRVVHSVGSRRQLRALRRSFAGRRLAAISIHRRLLDAATVAELRARAEMIICWPVATIDEAQVLGRWGVDGVITEHFEALSPVLGEAAA